MIKRYLDFELKIKSDGKEIEIDIDGRPYGFNIPAPLKLPLMPQTVNYKSLTPDPAAIAAAGHSLFESIFLKDVKTAFASYLSRRSETEGVRICISTQSNVLGEWVWEILCNELQPAINFLALDPKTPIIRITRMAREIYARRLTLPLRMLIILASPGSLAPIDMRKEKDSIEKALRDAIAQKQIIVDYLGFDDQTEANYDTLQEWIAGKAIPYDVVHIISHGMMEPGEEAEVVFTRPADGGLQIINASGLAGLFRSRGVMLVVLQSCQSGVVDPTVNSFSSIAQQMVASGVPAVLAMQDAIEQDVAADFIGKLYKQWINTGTPFEDALTQARQSLNQRYQGRIAPWAIPVFYIVPGLQLILEQPSSEESKPSPTLLQTTVATERQVDAALPKQMRLGKETDLLVLIRIPSAPGLREKLGTELRDFEATSEDVLTSPTFDVEFKKDTETGKPLPFIVKITIDTKDFTLERTEARVQVRPQGDSVLSIFPLTAKKKGPAKILIRVLDTSEQEVTLAELLLRTDVRTGGTFETEYLVTETILTPFRPKQPTEGGMSEGVLSSSDNIEEVLNEGSLVHGSGSVGGIKIISSDRAKSIRFGSSERTFERISESDYSTGNTYQEANETNSTSGGTATGTMSRRSRTITAIFHDRESAERAFRALSERGYTTDDVNLLMSDETRKTHFSSDDTADTELGSKALEGAGAGAAIGGTTGAVLAAIAAIGTSVALPGLGLLVAGPLAGALVGAGAGGATGGLIGALVGSGVSEDRAKIYEEGVRNGGIVIGITVRDDEDAEYFENSFRSHGGEHIYR